MPHIKSQYAALKICIKYEFFVRIFKNFPRPLFFETATFEKSGHDGGHLATLVQTQGLKFHHCFCTKTVYTNSLGGPSPFFYITPKIRENSGELMYFC
jgi:hypothetical protein